MTDVRSEAPAKLTLLDTPMNGTRVLHREADLALVNADCREMIELASDSVDLVVTDPPFNVGFSSYGGGVKDTVPPEMYAQWTEEWLLETLRVLKPGGQLYALMSLKLMPWWLPLVRDMRWHILPFLKTLAHLHREKTYIRAWEPVLWIIKGDGPPNVFRRTYRFEQDKDWLIGPTAVGESELLRVKKKHPTPRPDWFYEHFIIRGSRRGMTVLDPMMGSGTGARASRRLGRAFVGYDINPDYVAGSAELIAQMPFDLGDIPENIDAYRQPELVQRWWQPRLDLKVPFPDQEEEVPTHE